jgi:hypothetical protein
MCDARGAQGGGRRSGGRKKELSGGMAPIRSARGRVIVEVSASGGVAMRRPARGQWLIRRVWDVVGGQRHGGVLPTNVWPDRQFKGKISQSPVRDFAAAVGTTRVAADVREKISRDGAATRMINGEMKLLEVGAACSLAETPPSKRRTSWTCISGLQLRVLITMSGSN